MGPSGGGRARALLRRAGAGGVGVAYGFTKLQALRLAGYGKKH
jgi:hypothetical protein